MKTFKLLNNLGELLKVLNNAELSKDMDMLFDLNATLKFIEKKK
jgi:hypothetical protein